MAVELLPEITPPDYAQIRLERLVAEVDEDGDRAAVADASPRRSARRRRSAKRGRSAETTSSSSTFSAPRTNGRSTTSTVRACGSRVGEEGPLPGFGEQLARACRRAPAPAVTVTLPDGHRAPGSGGNGEDVRDRDQGAAHAQAGDDRRRIGQEGRLGGSRGAAELAAPAARDGVEVVHPAAAEAGAARPAGGALRLRCPEGTAGTRIRGAGPAAGGGGVGLRRGDRRRAAPPPTREHVHDEHCGHEHDNAHDDDHEHAHASRACAMPAPRRDARRGEAAGISRAGGAARASGAGPRRNRPRQQPAGHPGGDSARR